MPKRKPPPLTAIDARSTANRHAAYELAKRELPPTLTPREYEQACRALAKRYRV